MKVIDLLNKIANEEEVPERIIFFDNEFYYDEDNLKYRNIEKGKDDLFEHIDFYKGLVLNDEVEIIEDTPKEDKKIEKLDLQYKDIIYNPNFKANILIYCDNLQFKINEIIDKINGE